MPFQERVFWKVRWYTYTSLHLHIIIVFTEKLKIRPGAERVDLPPPPPPNGFRYMKNVTFSISYPLLPTPPFLPSTLSPPPPPRAMSLVRSWQQKQEELTGSVWCDGREDDDEGEEAYAPQGGARAAAGCSEETLSWGIKKQILSKFLDCSGKWFYYLPLIRFSVT